MLDPVTFLICWGIGSGIAVVVMAAANYNK